MDSVEEIRSRLNIEDIVAPYVQLKKSGRNFKACCPFHQEKTPSFIISPDKGLAYCFGCRKGGDIFAFIQEIENMSFPEAVNLLADRAGVTVKKSTFSKKKKDEKDRTIDLLNEAQKFFAKQLSSQEKALSYLSSRGYELAAVKSLKLGFAPDDFHALEKHLTSKKYTPKEILEAGLASQKDVGSQTIYDRFRNRITFPIHDTQGRLVGFGGRTLATDPGTPKYLNSPETSLYHKGRTLYYFHQSKEPIRKQDAAVIVEGYFDVLTAHLNGFTNVVASLGTALTADQLKLIGRFTKNISFAFDADISGQAANARSIELAQQQGFNIHIIQIPSGKDPDDAIRSDTNEWIEATDKAENVMDFYFSKTLKAYDLNTLDGKKSIASELLTIIAHISNAIEKEHFIQKLAGLLRTSVQSLYEELKKVKIPPSEQNQQYAQPTPTPSAKLQTPSFSRKDCLLGLLLLSPDTVAKIKETLNCEIFPEGEHKSLYKELWNAYTKPGQTHDTESIVQHISKKDTQVHEKLNLLTLYTENKYLGFTDEERENEITGLCNTITRDHHSLRLKNLRFRMSEVEQSGDKKKYDNLMKEYSDLLRSNHWH